MNKLRLCENCQYGLSEPNKCLDCKVITFDDLEKENYQLRDRVKELEDILHEYFVARAGYMHHATERLARECHEIDKKRQGL